MLKQYVLHLFLWKPLIITPVTLKATSGITKEFQKTAGSHMNGLQKAAGSQ
jgi:hypothetical protein